ncbi:MAG: anhydro-N-acetylmuramic acid kinase [Aquabacterium sp.]|uniref:anhydro-N-acetylmuramic acid kinase n=1 Tax=Aquabacterium sp. TaxID=1872578 RepID=UPI003BEE102F
MKPDLLPSARASGLFSELYIGLMSGTSLDGVDGVIARTTPHGWETVAHQHRPFPSALRDSLMALNTPGADELHRSALAAQALARMYAEVVEALLTDCSLPASAIQAIGAHGQTVRHRPELGYTLQINQPALLAELTGIDVVADFRSRDVAAGGHGAPLVPAFHQAVFAQPTHTVAVLNVGGMANVSILRPEHAPLGFDCGPGNALLDLWCHTHTGRTFDADGAWGASGQVHADALQAGLQDPFFLQAPPKSTGRDLFNPDWLARWLTTWPHAAAPADVQATLCELTARSAAEAIQQHAPEAKEVIVCGGGALNGDLMRRLNRHLAGAKVLRSDERGLNVMQVEAAAFAWLAWTHVQRQAGNVPAVTGAAGPRVLGALYPAR